MKASDPPCSLDPVAPPAVPRVASARAESGAEGAAEAATGLRTRRPGLRKCRETPGRGVSPRRPWPRKPRRRRTLRLGRSARVRPAGGASLWDGVPASRPHSPGRWTALHQASQADRTGAAPQAGPQGPAGWAPPMPPTRRPGPPRLCPGAAPPRPCPDLSSRRPGTGPPRRASPCPVLALVGPAPLRTAGRISKVLGRGCAVYPAPPTPPLPLGPQSRGTPCKKVDSQGLSSRGKFAKYAAGKS